MPSIAEAHRAFASGAASPVEMARGALERIGRLEPRLHAFVTVTAERAMADARASEARWSVGAPLGPLDGVPIAHKDIYETAGIGTTGHSRLLQDHVPERDATVVRQWRAAGTVMLGKLATHEFAFGGPSFDLPWPPARNPWDTAHFTAGSSSGTAAAIASGMILGGTGSDTGGSIRGPAALCGLAGIKPTYGLCSRAGVLPLAFSLDTTGPMAWTVEDCALLLDAMAGPDFADPASARGRAPVGYAAAVGNGVRGLRIGVTRDWVGEQHPVSAAAMEALEGAVATFRGLGAVVEDVVLPPMADFAACGFVIMICEAYALHEPWLRTRRGEYGELFRDRVSLAGVISGADYLQAQRKRRELCAAVAGVMRGCDLLLTGAASGEAPAIDAVPKWSSFERPGFTMPFNVTGQPALSVCAGYGVGGLPVAIQLVGRPFEDAVVLAAGHAYETGHPWRQRRPDLVG